MAFSDSYNAPKIHVYDLNFAIAWLSLFHMCHLSITEGCHVTLHTRYRVCCVMVSASRLPFCFCRNRASVELSVFRVIFALTECSELAHHFFQG